MSPPLAGGPRAALALACWVGLAAGGCKGDTTITQYGGPGAGGAAGAAGDAGTSGAATGGSSGAGTGGTAGGGAAGTGGTGGGAGGSGGTGSAGGGGTGGGSGGSGATGGAGGAAGVGGGTGGTGGGTGATGGGAGATGGTGGGTGGTGGGAGATGGTGGGTGGTGGGAGATGGTGGATSGTGGTGSATGGTGGSAGGAGAGGSAGADPCAAVTCSTPPPDTCVDATTRREHSTTGTCSGGLCDYSPRNVTCPFGCSAGACQPDPCAGITCTTPPGAACVAGPAVRTWTSPGTCSAGTCSYTPSDATCSGTANGTATCSGGVCGISCNPGFQVVGTGSSATCQNIDECADTSTCGVDIGAGSCFDSAGSYQCTCNAGHSPAGSGLNATCIDDDECAIANGGCPTGASCTNLPGTFSCDCPGTTTECTGACVDTDVDPAHCGSCGNALTGAQYCVDGAPVSVPQVSQASSALAEAADVVVLEGTFGASAAVTVAGFPAASVSALAAGRLRVEVPATAGAGDIVVTTGGATATWGTFRRVGFTLGLEEFRSEYEQEGYGRQMPFLATPRSHATSIATDRWWYVVGGTSTAGAALRSIERGMINADGTVGELQDSGEQLVVARSKAAGVRVGGWFYVIGGASGATPLASVERAPINTDGTLGVFASFSASTLTTARSGHAAVVLGGYVYVIGGAAAGGAALASIERAPILAQGALGAFTPHWASLTSPRDGAVAFATETHLFVVGGRSGATHLASIEAAPLGPTLGGAPTAFASAGTLASGGRSHARLLRLGSHVFVAGGAGATGPRATVEELQVGGAPPTVTAVASGGPLRAAREAPAVAVIGNHAYVVGGVSSGGTLDTVERAAVNTSGNLGTRAVLANAVADQVRNGTTRSYAAIGPYLYLLGGGSNGNGACASGPWPVLRWPVDAAGRLGTMETMPYAVGGLSGSVFVTGSTVCVAPGRQGASAATNAVLCAAIATDASLGPFTQETTLPESPEAVTFIVLRDSVTRLTPFSSGGVAIAGTLFSAPFTAGLPGAFVSTGVTMPSPTLCYAYGTPVLLGPEFYGLGGYPVTSTQSTRVDRVVFDALGNPTSPTTAAASGGAPQYLPQVALVGPYVYAVGGGSPPRTSMTRARLAQGSVPAHQAYGGATLATGRQSGGAITLGNYLYVLGGYDGLVGCNTFSGSNPDAEQFVLR